MSIAIMDEDWLADRLRRGGELFNLVEHRDFKVLERAIWKASDVYECEKLSLGKMLSADENKKKRDRFAASLLSVIENFNDLSPEDQIGIQLRARDEEGDFQPFIDKFLEDVAYAKSLVDRFEQTSEKPKGRRPDWALKLAIDELLPVVEELAGHKVVIKHNKAMQKPPEPNSSAAEYLLETLLSFDASLNAAKVLLMIKRIKKGQFNTVHPLEAATEGFPHVPE